MTAFVLNPRGVAAVAAIIRESSDLSEDEAVLAATALLNAYFVARESVSGGARGDTTPDTPASVPAPRRETPE